MKFKYQIALSSALFVATLPTVQAEIQAETPMSIPGVEFSGEVAFTTDYVFRGISLTDENFAIQGEFDATHSSGVYVGIWSSNVNFMEDNTVPPGDRANIEVDLYIGYAGEVSGFGYDFFATRYIYPGTGNDPDTGKDHQYNDYHEFAMAFSYSFPAGTKLGVEYDYAPHWAGNNTGQAHNYQLKIDHEIGNGFSIGAVVGRQSFINDHAIRFNNNYDDYTYFGTRIAYTTTNDFTLALDFSDTTIKDTDGDPIDGTDERLVFTLSKSF